MALMVGEEEVLYILPSTLEHSTDNDKECYFAHEPDLFISDLMQDVLMVNPLLEYFQEKLAEESIQHTNPPPT